MSTAWVPQTDHEPRSLGKQKLWFWPRIKTSPTAWAKSTEKTLAQDFRCQHSEQVFEAQQKSGLKVGNQVSQLVPRLIDNKPQQDHGPDQRLPRSHPLESAGGLVPTKGSIRQVAGCRWSRRSRSSRPLQTWPEMSGNGAVGREKKLKSDQSMGTLQATRCWFNMIQHCVRVAFPKGWKKDRCFLFVPGNSPYFHRSSKLMVDLECQLRSA